jgi:hypothetical protein
MVAGWAIRCVLRVVSESLRPFKEKTVSARKGHRSVAAGGLDRGQRYVCAAEEVGEIDPRTMVSGRQFIDASQLSWRSASWSPARDGMVEGAQSAPGEGRAFGVEADLAARVAEDARLGAHLLGGLEARQLPVVVE